MRVTRLFMMSLIVAIGVAGIGPIEATRAQQGPPEPVMNLPAAGVDVPLRVQQGRPIVEYASTAKDPTPF